MDFMALTLQPLLEKNTVDFGSVRKRIGTRQGN